VTENQPARCVTVRCPRFCSRANRSLRRFRRALSLPMLPVQPDAHRSGHPDGLIWALKKMVLVLKNSRQRR
jgi:hypothetical protein